MNLADLGQRIGEALASLRWAGTLASLAFATFIGAWIAFRLETRHKQKERRREQFLAGKRAQFALTSQYSYLRHLIKYLDRARDNPERWLALPPVFAHGRALSVDLSSIDYVLDGASANLLSRLLLGEIQIATVDGILDERNRTRVSFSERAEEYRKTRGLRDFESVPEAEVLSAIGFDVVQMLKDFTESLYDTVDRAAITNEKNMGRLFDYLTAEFPDQKPLSTETLEYLTDEIGEMEATEARA